MIDTLLIIVMIVGILFYSGIMILFFLGKNKMNNAGGSQSIGFGKLNVKASEFIILALVSAVFVLAPIFYYYYKEEPVVPVVEKEGTHEFIIRGQAIDDNNKIKSNVNLFAVQMRNDSAIVKKRVVTDQAGLYVFRFEKALPKDQFIVTWTEPDNREKSKTFEFNEISYPILITLNSN